MKVRFSLGTGTLNIEPQTWRWTLQEDGVPVLLSAKGYRDSDEARKAGIDWTIGSGLMTVEIVEVKPKEKHDE